MKNKIRRETLYLYLVQISNVVLPLISIPYLTSVLGVEYFGKFSYAQAVGFIAVFLVDFGFNYSAARHVGINLGNKNEINRVYTNVQFVKILLFACVMGVGLLVAFIIPQHSIDRNLFIVGLSSSFASVLMPLWLFQGLGRNSQVAFLNLLFRLISLLLIFAFVRSREDALLASFLQLFAPVMAGLAMQILIAWKKTVSLSIEQLSVKGMVNAGKESFHNFSASFFTLGFTYFNPLVIKFVLGDSVLGAYALADKLASVLKQLYTPLVQANFSSICSDFGSMKFSEVRVKIKKILFVFSGLSICGLLCNYFMGDWVIKTVFGREYNVTALLSIMIVTQFFISLSLILVNLIIIPAGLSAHLKKIYFLALLFYCSIIYPMVYFGGVYGVAVAVSLVELLVVLLFLIFVKNGRLLGVKV